VLAALLATAAVVTLALGWFGLRMLQQESAIQQERSASGWKRRGRDGGGDPRETGRIG
jgi:hypothetical protein